MAANQPIKYQLLALGWLMYSECVTPCAKQYFYHPGKPGYRIVARPKMNSFSILQNNHIIAGSFWGYMLEEKLAIHIV